MRSSGPGGGPSSTIHRTTARGHRGRRSTTGTRSTTAIRSATTAPRSPTRRCPTSTSTRRSTASSSRRRTSSRCSPSSTRYRATCRGTASPQTDSMEPGRQRVDLQPDSEGSTRHGAFWSDPSRVQAAYGTVDRVLAEHADVVRPALWQQEPGHDRPRRPPPLPIVSGLSSNHDVPISIIAHDPKVLKQIGSWGWNAGPAPPPERAPVADERVPRQVPHRLRLAPADPVASGRRD